MKSRLQHGVSVSGLLALALGLVLVASSGCSDSKKCEPGSEKCPCFATGACNPGLTCASDLCVATGPIGTGGTGDPIGTGGTTGTGGVDPRCAVSSPTSCDTCMGSYCCNETITCIRNTSCYNFVQCGSACGSDNTCINGCATSYPSGVSPFMDIAYCMQDNCTTPCQ
jgi:hypothetical protein